jgi:hypothetical protein
VIVVLGEGLGDVAEQEISAPVEVIKDQTGRQERADQCIRLG